MNFMQCSRNTKKHIGESKEIRMKKNRSMELGVLSRFADDDSNPFDVIARYGVATTQLCLSGPDTLER